MFNYTKKIKEMIYETTVQYTIIDGNGNDRVIKQKYIVLEAVNHGDAEEQAYEECASFTDIDIIAVKRSKIKEVLNKRESEKQSIFMADVADIITDDDGEEKEILYKMAFYSTNTDTAYAYIKEYLKQGYNLSLVGLKRTKYVDVI